MDEMTAWRKEFLIEAEKQGALQFGEFTLKSGRVSPYFFNSGMFASGASFDKLCKAYATAIDEGLRTGGIPEFDVLFGPAYKGIPLVACVAALLARDYNRDFPFVYNRKELKDHGEGGMFVGATKSLSSGTGEKNVRVLIVDDVMTAGTAVGEAIELLKTQVAAPGAVAVGVVIALDREEVGGETDGKRSAVQKVEATHKGLLVTSIVKFRDLIKMIEERKDHGSLLEKLNAYRRLYGST